MSATTSGGKSKIFGFLKGIFHKSESANSNNEEPAVKESSSASSPTPPLPGASAKSARNGGNGNGHSPARSAAKGDTTLTITLSGIVNCLPSDLLAKVRQPEVGDATVSIALEKVLSQLSQGTVRVPFGDIRQAAPSVFATGPESDRIAVPLPLNEILSQLNPNLLIRRPAQKQVEIPSEISSPFDGKGKGLVFSVGNAKPVTPAAPRQAVPAPATPARGAISSVPTPTPPPAAPSIPMLKSVTPPVPAAPSTPVIPFSPITPKPTIPPVKPVSPPRAVTPPAQPPAAPAAPKKTMPSVPHPVAPQPAAKQPIYPRPAQSNPAMVPTAKPAANVEKLAVSLKALAENWPEALRQEIAQLRLMEAQVLLPCDAVESALKSGKAAFSWGSIQSWLQPPAPATNSVHGSTELELPLKVLAPVFFARKNGAIQPHQKVAIDESIPNLFFGFPGAETAPPPTGSTSRTPKPKAESVNKPVDTNYYIWDDSSDSVIAEDTTFKPKPLGGTDFVARYATPNEIVSRAAALDGVAGALIALPDGLMVASRIPSELNGDTLAAFLPQIFAKVNQCTRELRMGELNNLNFTVGNIPWKIFRVNAIFFAAFGRVAEPLPTAGLAALAAELDRKQR